MLTTSLYLLRHARPRPACKPRYAVLRRALGRLYGDKTPIPLTKIIETNGLDDALWSLRALSPGQEAERERVVRRFLVWVCRFTPLPGGRILLDLITDTRSRNIVEKLKRGEPITAEDVAAVDADDYAAAAAYAAANANAARAAYDGYVYAWGAQAHALLKILTEEGECHISAG